MPKIDLDAIAATNATKYPARFAHEVRERWVRRLAPATGIDNFGASHVELKPGAWSSQRHWHEDEDELVVMLSGEAVLVDDDGRTQMRPGDIAVFPRGDGNGHHLINESAAPCTFVAIGRPPIGHAHYPDIDLSYDGGIRDFRRKDGRRY